MICFRNKDSRKNFGETTGKEFAVYFENNSSYFVYRDGSTKLMKENATEDRKLFENNAKNPAGELYVIEFEDIKWNLLDFSNK